MPPRARVSDRLDARGVLEAATAAAAIDDPELREIVTRFGSRVLKRN